MKPKHKSTRSAKRQSLRSSLNNTKTTMVTKCKNGKHSRVTGGTPIRKTRRFLKNSRVQKRKSINKAMKIISDNFRKDKLSGVLSTSNNNSNSSPSITADQSNIEKVVGTNETSNRKLKRKLRGNVLKNFKKLKKELSTTEDCVLIEVPEEIIVIDDDDDDGLESNILSLKNSLNQNREIDFEKMNIGMNAKSNNNVLLQECNDTNEISTNFYNISLTAKDNHTETQSIDLTKVNSELITVENQNISDNKNISTESVVEIIDFTNLDVIADSSHTVVKPPLYEISKTNSQILGNEKIVLDKEVYNVIDSTGIIQDGSAISNKTDDLKNNSNCGDSIVEKENNVNTISLPAYKQNLQKSNTKDSILGNNQSIKENSHVDDESVVFVGEVKGSVSTSSTIDFIPLESPGGITCHRRKTKKRLLSTPSKMLWNPFKKFKMNLESNAAKFSTPKAKKNVGEMVFTDSEKKRNENYNSNTYNPNKNAIIGTAEKRMIIIDGSNVAFGHGNSNCFSTRGLEIAILFFENKGHEVKAIVPQFRTNYNRSTDGEKLKELNRAGKIVFTPGKNLPDLKATSYDDRFILQLALELDAAVVSNDNYRDLINENPGFKKLIENRVITYTWCNDIFIVAKDPYGKKGPTLEQILCRNINHHPEK